MNIKKSIINNKIIISYYNQKTKSNSIQQNYKINKYVSRETLVLKKNKNNGY